MSALRSNLLAGHRIAVSGTAGHALSAALLELGAEVEFLAVDQLSAEDERVGEWARARVPLNALVHCAGIDPALEEAWAAVREVATGALIEADAPGKVVLVAPRPDAGRAAAAARAGLENLARTLSVEWARYAMTAVAIVPGVRTSDEQLAQVVCFAVSEGGGYLSGCRLELGAVA
jgi:hypothetical protein